MSSNLTVARQCKGLVFWLLLTGIAAALGSAASMQAGAFYGQLMQPAWAPPAWVFGPTWTVLYVLMAVAAWLVWRINGFASARPALILYLGQLVLNALWTWLFFKWQLGAWALLDILLLWCAIVATALGFWVHKPLAAWLLLPYFLWVSFAIALNYTVWQLNPTVLG